MSAAFVGNSIQVFCEFVALLFVAFLFIVATLISKALVCIADEGERFDAEVAHIFVGHAGKLVGPMDKV